MAFDELEKRWKKYLHSREIVPREDAWNAIEARLGPEARRGRKPVWLWPAVAAAALALVMGYFWYLRGPEPLPGGTPLVQNPGGALAPTGPREGLAQTPQEGQPEAETRAGPSVRVRSAEIPLWDQGRPELETTWAGKPPVPPLQDRDTARLSELIARQLDTVLTQVTLLEEGQHSVTDAEIDSLLRQAQLAIARQSRNDSLPGVNALALLGEAEQELDRSFREQILEKLKSGYLKVRTAVADRNQ